MNDARITLTGALRRRTPTWTVARAILDLRLGLPGELVAELRQLAGSPSWHVEMNDDFDRVDPADTQLETFHALMPGLGRREVTADDPQALHALVRDALQALGASAYPTAGEALADFRNIDLTLSCVSSRQALRKRLRFLRRLEAKIARVADTQRLRHAQMQAKSRLAHRIDPDACDDLTLAFCAYLAARANRRSLFMIGPQSRAQDTISAALEAHLERSAATAWDQVALVKPTLNVIQRLDDAQRGRLIGVYHAAMADAAEALGDLHPSLPERMRAEMVMVRGVDSSRWNAYAGALNTMRSAWLNTTLACGLEEVLDVYCPGKAPRLMAADVVWWARNAGQDLHEDTRMFAALARPWDVVAGRSQQGREDVLSVAAQLGVDAQASGWVGPRAAQERERPEPEPALVHGVVVGDPQLAVTLRRCRAFSGRALRELERLPDALTRAELVDGDRHTQVVLGASADR